LDGNWVKKLRKLTKLKMLDLNNMSVEVDRRQEWAGQVDVLLMRLELLELRDRVLVEAYIKHNVPVRLLALLSGRRRESVARQMKRLIGRVLAEEYITIVRNKDMFSRKELDVAYDCFLLGLGYRAIAVKRKLNMAATRKIIRTLRKEIEHGCRGCDGLTRIKINHRGPEAQRIRGNIV
jgi:hypothetical protein